MIKKLRWKFTAVFMAVVCLFLAGILLTLFYFSHANFERRSAIALRQAVEGNIQARQDRYQMIGGYPVLLASKDGNGHISVYSNQIFYINDKNILEIIAQIDREKDAVGSIQNGDLRYLRLDTVPNTRRYAVVDVYAEQTVLRTQGFYSLIIGIGAALLFFGVSLLLSHWIVGPVEAAWNRQRQFVADASHELKTPLTVILSNVDLLIAAEADADQKTARRLDHIRGESRRMRGLVEALLTLARADSGVEAVKPECVCLSEIVSYAALTMEPAIYDLGRTMKSDIAENLYVQGDAQKLRQLVDILMDNAGKYSAPGSLIRVKLEQSGKKDVLFSVISEGKPIADAELQDIFERFYRSDQSRGQEKGYGLGLSIAKSIALQHGGKIWAQTDNDKTNAFFVRLTQHPAPPTAEP